MGFLVMIKRIFVTSALRENEVEARFFNDKEWKIVLKCGDFGESNVDFGESREDFGESSGESNGDSSDSSTDSQITITFFALQNDIDCLVSGYLRTFLGFDFSKHFKCENNHIFVDSPLSKDEILSRLRQKDIIQSCEQISLNDKKIMRDSVIMPFNGSRAIITREILEANRDFFSDLGESSDLPIARHCESLRSKANQSINKANFPHKARIILNLKSRESNKSNAESFDTNPKNAIYKAIGKAFTCATNSAQIATKSPLKESAQINANSARITTQSLLDGIIFLNFHPDIESLKILILQKCTFIVCYGIPAFSVVRFAQKFGITLIAFANNDFLILTHALRFKA